MDFVVVNMGPLSCKSLEGRQRSIGERQGNNVNELTIRTIIACNRSVRAQLDLLQGKG